MKNSGYFIVLILIAGCSEDPEARWGASRIFFALLVFAVAGVFYFIKWLFKKKK